VLSRTAAAPLEEAAPTKVRLVLCAPKLSKLCTDILPEPLCDRIDEFAGRRGDFDRKKAMLLLHAQPMMELRHAALSKRKTRSTAASSPAPKKQKPSSRQYPVSVTTTLAGRVSRAPDVFSFGTEDQTPKKKTKKKTAKKGANKPPKPAPTKTTKDSRPVVPDRGCNRSRNPRGRRSTSRSRSYSFSRSASPRYLCMS
jgi:hypothetical protein